MVKQPDLPNVPMTRWISYIALFNYVMNHVPATAHVGVDGLSRRKRTDTRCMGMNVKVRKMRNKDQVPREKP